MMNHILKSTVKFAVGTCIALGSVALAASVVAGSSAAKVVSAGAKAAKDAMKEEMERGKKPEGDTPAEETAESAETAETADDSSAD